MAPITDRFPSNRQLRWMLAAAILLFLGLRVWLAGRLELYSDEIFYWLASTRPALAYSDLPFMTALLAGLGDRLAESSPLAVRSLFLATGAIVPLLVTWVARPLFGERDALLAGLMTLCLPLLLFLGLLAVPDVPLVVLGTLLIGLSERATRLDRTGWWLAAGVVAALGLSTHYRFILFPVALVLFLLLSPSHRYLWSTAQLWVAGLIALVGLYPSLSYNLQTNLSGLDYHLVSRHPWTFQTEGLLHLPTQMAIVTPLLYVLLLFTLVMLWKEARRGNDRSLLFALFATVPLGLYLVLSPWADTTRTTLHWPLSGYIPLLVHTPRALRQLGTVLHSRLGGAAVRRWLIAVPATGLLGGLLALAGIGSQAFSAVLQQWIDSDRLSSKMSGWSELTHSISDALARDDREPVLVTDNYYTAAQLLFHLGPDQAVFTLDRDKAVRDGRLTQLRLWGLHEQGLRRHFAGHPALLITEDATLNLPEKRRVIDSACRVLDSLSFNEALPLLDGLKPFSLYSAETIAGPDDMPATGFCPYPSEAWLDQPAPGSQHEQTLTVAGWAFNDGAGIRSVHLLTGEQRIPLSRDVARPDVAARTNGGDDPAAPQLGFDRSIPLEDVPSGTVTLQLEVIANDGQRQRFRPIRIEHL